MTTKAPEWQTNPGMNAAYTRLEQISGCRLIQGRAFLEGATGGVMPNKYTFGDPNIPHESKDEQGQVFDTQPMPMFIIEEEADGCCTSDFCCRVCCNPNHPAVLKMYVASAPIKQPPCGCCGMTCNQPPDKAEKEGAAFITMERFGCCDKLPHCFVCCEMCQDEMRIHAGDVGGHQGGGFLMPGQFGDTSVIMSGKVPIGGGGCTPTIELYERQAPGVISAETWEQTMGQPFGVVEGPTCFGGCADFCCDTQFWVGNTPGAADVAHIIKKKPEDCNGWCRACCTPADTYDLKLEEGGKAWAPEKKAMMLANMVHLDYMFFENDKFPVTCESTDDGTLWITILCCLCYCYGCLCPIQCSIPCKANNDN